MVPTMSWWALVVSTRPRGGNPNRTLYLAGVWPDPEQAADAFSAVSTNEHVLGAWVCGYTHKEGWQCIDVARSGNRVDLADDVRPEESEPMGALLWEALGKILHTIRYGGFPNWMPAAYVDGIVPTTWFERHPEDAHEVQTVPEPATATATTHPDQELPPWPEDGLLPDQGDQAGADRQGG